MRRIAAALLKVAALAGMWLVVGCCWIVSWGCAWWESHQVPAPSSSRRPSRVVDRTPSGKAGVPPRARPPVPPYRAPEPRLYTEACRAAAAGRDAVAAGYLLASLGLSYQAEEARDVA